MPCEEKKRLAELYAAAARDLSAAVTRMSQSFGTLDGFTQAKADADEKQEATDTALAALDEHTAEHSC